MSKYPNISEVISQAIIDRGESNPRNVPIDTETTRHATEIYTSTLKNLGARSMHEDMVSSWEGVDEQKSKILIEKGIGWEIDPNTDKTTITPGSEEENRQKEVTQYEEVSRKLLEQGYDSLPVDDKKIILDGISKVFNSLPQFKQLLDSLDATSVPGIRDKVLERWAKDPRFINKVRETYKEIFNSENLDNYENQIKTIRDSIGISKDLEKRIGEVETRKSNIQGELDSLIEEVYEFEKQSNPFGISKLEELEKNIESGEKEVLDAKEYIKDADQKIESLRTYVKDLRTDDAKMKLFDQIKQIEESDELGKAKQRIKDYEELIKQRDKLKNKWEEQLSSKKQKESEAEQSDEELKVVKEEKAKSDADRDIAIEERKKSEREFAKNAQEVFETAMKQVLVEQVEAAQEAYKTKIELLKEHETDPVKLVFLDQLGSRWTTLENKNWVTLQMKRKFLEKKGKLIEKPNLSTINADFENVMKNEGDSIDWAHTDETGVVTTNFQIELTSEGLKYTDPVTKEVEVLPGDARNLLVAKMIIEGGITNPKDIVSKLKDIDFMEDMRQQAIVDLLSRKIQSGTLTEADIHKIRFSGWGEGVIEAALAADKTRKDLYDELRKSGVIPSTMWESIKDINKSKATLWMLLILFAGPGVLSLGLVLKTLNKK